MITGPIPPKPPTPLYPYPSAVSGPMRNASVYEKMRMAITSNFTGALPYGALPYDVKALVRLIKDQSRDITGNEMQEAELKAALIQYLTVLLKNDAGQKEIVDFVKTVQEKAGVMGNALQKEQLPTILATLLAQANFEKAKSLGHLVPLTPGGKLTLHLADQTDKEIHERLQSKESWFNASSFFRPSTDVEIPLEKLSKVFDTREQYHHFLEGWFTRELIINPQIEGALVALLTNIKFETPSLQTHQPFLVELTKIVIPKLVDKLLVSLSGETLTALLDHSAGAIKDHFDSLRETETKIGKIKDQIDWLKKALLNNSVKPTDEYRKFSEAVWGQDLFELSLEGKKEFFDTQISSYREDHYLEEAHYSFWNLKPVFDKELQEFQKALFAPTIPPEKIEELNQKARALWDVDFTELHRNENAEKRFLIMSLAYQKALHNQAAENVAHVIGSYAASLISADVLRDTIEDLSHLPNSQWNELERTFPPARHLRRQLEEGKAQKDDLFNFLPFLNIGLPELLQGALQLSIEKNMAPNLLSVRWINKMIDETLLPTITDSIHGVMISNIIQQHRHKLMDALVDPDQEQILKMLVGTDYRTLINEEGLKIPPGIDVDDVVKKTLENLHNKMKDLFAQGYDEATLRQGIIEFLKEDKHFVTGDSQTVYPELILTALTDLTGLPPYLKGVLQSMPGYSSLASQLSKAVTASLAPYREGHGQLVRDLTKLFIDLAQPKKPEKAVELTPSRPIEEQVAEVSKVATVLLKRQVAKNGLSSYVFKYLPVESMVSSVFSRALNVLKHPIISNPLYHHRAVIFLMGGKR